MAQRKPLTRAVARKAIRAVTEEDRKRKKAREAKAQEVLKVPVRKSKSRIRRWFTDHSDAEEFLATWLKMRAAGESSWSVEHLRQHLREEWGFPFKSYSSLSTWIKDTWPGEYQAAIEKMREEQK